MRRVTDSFIWKIQINLICNLWMYLSALELINCPLDDTHKYRHTYIGSDAQSTIHFDESIFSPLKSLILSHSYSPYKCENAKETQSGETTCIIWDEKLRTTLIHFIQPNDVTTWMLSMQEGGGRGDNEGDDAHQEQKENANKEGTIEDEEAKVKTVRNRRKLSIVSLSYRLYVEWIHL